MANQFKLQATIQNVMFGRGTIPKVRHGMAPSITQEGLYSAATSISGSTSNNTISFFNDRILVNGTDILEPFTNASGGVEKVNGVSVYAYRAAAGTATTGVVDLTFTDVPGIGTTADIPLQDNGFFCYYNEAPDTITDSTIELDFTGTTGFRVDVVIIYTHT